MKNENLQLCRWHEPKFQARSQQVIASGKELIGPTALTNGKDVSGLDIHAIEEFFDVLTPDPSLYPDLENYDKPGGLKEHCLFSGRIAYKLALAVNKSLGTHINPYAQMAALELHDLGRTATHSFMETDELTGIYWKQIGIRDDLKAMTHSAHLYWDDGELKFDSLPPSTRISVLADVLGKRSLQNPNRLRHKEEVLGAVLQAKEKYLNKPNHTHHEEELLKHLPSYSEKEQYMITKALEWLDNMGIDVNKIVDKVIDEYDFSKEAVR